MPSLPPLVAIEIDCYSGGYWVTDSSGVNDQLPDFVSAVKQWNGS